MTKLLRSWLPVVAWVGLIPLFSTEIFEAGLTYRVVRAVLLFFASGLDPQTIHLVHTLLRKLAHVSEYFVLTFLLYRAFRQEASADRHGRWAWLALAVAVGMAALDEWHQRFEPRRTGSILDVGLDGVGVLMAQFVVGWQHRRPGPRPGSARGLPVESVRLQ